MANNYQDYVIKDGRLIGEFEKMYKECVDPWDQTSRERYQASKALIINACNRLKFENECCKTLEIGCGYANLSTKLFNLGFEVYATDISPTAIEEAKKINGNINLYVSGFSEYKLYKEISPDIFIMSEISWYILPEISKFIKYIKKYHKGNYLIHSLATYSSDIQQYGKEYFHDMNSILDYFNLDYLEYGEVYDKRESGPRTFFVAKI